MCKALKWFAGFAVIQLMKNRISDVASQEPKCVNETETYVNCFNKPIKEIPPGTEKIETLNISSIPKIGNLDANALTSYVHLKELSMINLRDWNIPENFLTPLNELEILNISCTNFGSTLKFPPSITKLSANKLGLQPGTLSSYDFSNLEKLTEISLSSNGIKQLPSLYKQAPIVYMDLSDNPIVNLSQAQLAQYCQLSRLKLNFEKGQVESCCLIKAWATEFGIENNLQCSESDGICTEKKYPMDTAALEIYDECSKKATNEESNSSYFYIINIVVLILLISALAFLAIKYYRARIAEAA